jgi:hypothetical protein
MKFKARAYKVSEMAFYMQENHKLRTFPSRMLKKENHKQWVPRMPQRAGDG